MHNNIINVFKSFKPQEVVNLAAQAGVRYSIANPKPYIDSNLIGFVNIIESCKNFDVENLIYASSYRLQYYRKTYSHHHYYILGLDN